MTRQLTNDEFIGWMRDNWHYAPTAEDMERLCRLAEIGAALHPRPISEADPTKLEQNYLSEMAPGHFWYIHYYPGTKKWKTSVFSDEKPTHFYDLDLLPKYNKET